MTTVETKTTEEKKEEVTLLSPTEYFEKVKDMKHETTEEDIQAVLENCLTLLEKPKITGQKKMAKKIYTQAQILLREVDAVKAGFNTYVLREDILYFIEKISKKPVKIIEMENYERELPDDVVDKLMAAKSYFDEFFIVFTDYTGETERTVEKEKRDKDPILFGCLYYPGTDKELTNRMYYITDWVDEYCDLTLEEMVMQYETKKKEGMTYKPIIPKTLDELKEVFALYDTKDPSKSELAMNKSSILSVSSNILNSRKNTVQPQNQKEESTTAKPKKRGRKKKTE